MNIVLTNKYNKKLQSPGALNIKETPGYKQKEKFTVALSKSVFADVSKEALPKRRIWVRIESLVFVRELSISLTVLKRVRLWLVNKGQ